MQMALKDVQSLPPLRKFKLTRVGVRNMKKLIYIHRKGRVIPLIATISAYVDLPSTQKGVHMSRNIEVVNEIINLMPTEKFSGLEDVMEYIARKLLERHEYAKTACARAWSYYFREETTPRGRVTVEYYKILAKAVVHRENGMKKMIGVQVVGSSACPCAMETTKEILNLDKKRVGITHNQRNIVTVLMEVPEGYDVDADDLIDIVNSSFSAPTYEYLKRDDEGALVVRMHENPMFVEDIVREILGRILERYSNLPDETMVIVRSESLESIHKHNAYAERIATLGELRS